MLVMLVQVRLPKLLLGYQFYPLDHFLGLNK
jgi:hypothetical protein